MHGLSRTAVPLAVLVLCAFSCASGVKLNQLMVKYGIIPKLDNLYDMPRTLEAASEDTLWAMAVDEQETKGYSVWCRDEDYRVCLLFDLSGSVAGIRVSHSIADLESTGVPQDFATIPDWEKMTMLGVPVFAATAFFVDPETLLEGGRTITEDTTTAEGIWIAQANGNPLKIPYLASELETTTLYTKQGCLPAQGLHYFHNVTESSGCVERGPYYMLYEKNQGTMLGFGVIIFGKMSQQASPHRQWFLNPPYIVADFVVPNGPACTKDWMEKYGSTSLHVFFREDPWFISCTALGYVLDKIVNIKDAIFG